MPNNVNINNIRKNGVSYYQLYFKCPVCLERGNQVSPSFWTHATDDGDIYNGENARYYCDRCETTEHIMKWKYRCPVHSNPNDDEYIEVTDKTNIAEAVSVSGQLVTITGIHWLQELLKNL